MDEWLQDPRCRAESANTIRRRILRGLSPEEAMNCTEPVSKGAKYVAFGESKSVSEWAVDPRCKVVKG